MGDFKAYLVSYICMYSRYWWGMSYKEGNIASVRRTRIAGLISLFLNVQYYLYSTMYVDFLFTLK